MKANRIISPALAAAVLGYGSMLDARVMQAENILPINASLSRHGQVALANDSLFQMGNVDVELSGYAVGYQDPSNLEAELNFLAPPVQQSNRFSFRTWDNKEAFLLDDGDNDIREIDGNFGELEGLHNTETESRTFNKGFCIRIDKDRVRNDKNWQQRYTGYVRTRLLRCDLRRAIALLNAAAVNTDKTWNTSADPDMDINAQISSARDISGVGVNSLYFGENAWNTRWSAYRGADTSGAFASSEKTLEQVGQYLGLPRTFKSDSRYQSSSSAKAQFLGSKVFLFLAMDNPMDEDPSNLKNFWSPCDNGERFQVYLAEFPKYYVIIVEQYSRPTLTASLGIRKLTIS